MQVIRGEEGDEEGDEDEDERSQLKVQALFSPKSQQLPHHENENKHHAHTQRSQRVAHIVAHIVLFAITLHTVCTGKVLFMGCFARFPRCQRSKGKSPSEEEGAEGEMGIPLPFLPLPD